MTAPVLSVSGLRKEFPAGFRRPPVTALDGIEFSMQPGEVFGLLGPNGAGKTTAVKIILGLTRATHGEVTLMGRAPGDPESRRRVGYLPEGHRFPGYLTARQTLNIFGRMSGMEKPALKKRGEELLHTVGIGKWADVKVKKFSKGMTQRLGLAAALVHDPEVLLLDEPTDGVDPVGRREIRDLLKSLAMKGTAILLNSHLLSEIELTCDRVAVLSRGKVARAGTISELTRTGTRYRLIASNMEAPVQARLRAAGAGVERLNGHLEIDARDLDHLNALIDTLRAGGEQIIELAPLRNSLEDVFVGLVKPSAGEPGKPEGATAVVAEPASWESAS